MLYIFDQQTEKLIAILKPDFTRSRTAGQTQDSAFLMAEFPAEFADSVVTEGCPYWDAVHREVLNGENTFEFTVPGNLDDAEYVREGNLVAFRDLDSYWQFFEIKRLIDRHGDGLTRTAYCEHILYELLDDIVTDKRPSADATAALAGMLEGTRWNVGIVDGLGNSSTTAYYESVLSAVQKVANAWKGELNWRCVITGGVITRYVDLRAMRGTDTGKQFVYSKDILDIEREVDLTSVVTALYGRGKGVETESGGYGRRLTFADVVALDKPDGQEWIGDSDALAQWGRPGGRHRFGVFTDEEETDPVALLEKTRAELARRKVPRVTYRLDVVSLEQLTGYEHEQVRLGDLVRVIDREFRPELVVSARVIELERDLLAPENTKVTLGSFAPSIIDAVINAEKRIDEISNRPYNTRWLDGKISILQNEIENLSSYVFLTPDDGILIMDAPTYEQATQAMKLGGGIFGIANQKDGQGGWNWRTFGTGAGFTADEINAGTIRADLVQVGSATQFEEGYDPVTKIRTFYGPKEDKDKISVLTPETTYPLTSNDIVGQRFKPIGDIIGAKRLKIAVAGGQHESAALPDKIIWKIVNDDAGFPGSTVLGYTELEGEEWPDLFLPVRVTIDLDTPLENKHYWLLLELESASNSQVLLYISISDPYADGYCAINSDDTWYIEADIDIVFTVEFEYPTKEGDLLFATDLKEWYRWDGTDWVKTDGASERISEHENQESPHNLPSYCRMQTDGFKIFDLDDNLMAHWGQIVPGVFGGKVNHLDGSFTQMTAEGLVRYIAGSGKRYHYLVHVGEDTTYNPGAVYYHAYIALPTHVVRDGDPDYSGGSTVYGFTYYGWPPGDDPDGTGPGDYYDDLDIPAAQVAYIILPDEFKGKDFQIFLYPKKIYALSNVEVYAGLTAQCGQPQIYLAVESKNIQNGTFYVRAYTYQRYDRMRRWYGAATAGMVFRFNNGSYITSSYTEWELSRVQLGLDFGYIVIY